MLLKEILENVDQQKEEKIKLANIPIYYEEVPESDRNRNLALALVSCVT